MKFTRHKILLISLGVLALLVACVGGWWGYVRYLSPQIEPSVAIYPVRGLDLSAHNGDVDFEAVRRAGYGFVMLKATEGQSFVDRRFDENYAAAREAGLLVGAYHFFRFDCDGRVQANHFLITIKDKEFDFPLTLDIEESGNPSGHENEEVVSTLKAAINHLELRGHDVMLYTNKGGYRKFVSANFPDYPLWICSFTDPPGPANWYMWQYTHRGHTEGVDGKVDINILSPAVVNLHHHSKRKF